MEVFGKVVMITGASTGIGLAAARLLTRHGARVALVARSAEVLFDLASELPGLIGCRRRFERDRAHSAGDRRGFYALWAGRCADQQCRAAFTTPIEQADIQLYRHLLDLNVVKVCCARCSA